MIEAESEMRIRYYETLCGDDVKAILVPSFLTKEMMS